MNSLHGKRILVTGATGFIGNRLVERLVLEQGVEVVALVHQFRNASRLARFPLRMVGGDVTDGACVRKAAEGCDAIVHAALSSSGTSQDNRRVTVEGTRNVCEAAKAVGARLVHFSTFSVYGETAPGLLKEDAPKNPGEDAYGASKLEAEHLVQQYQEQGVPTIILQPTVVYGPWSFWSTYTAGQLLSGEVALPDDGAGLCNAVYIDDVVDAVFLALQRKSIAHGSFLISADAPVTWRDYYLAHAGAIPDATVTGMTNEELAAMVRKMNEELAAKTRSRSLLRLLPPGLLYHLRGLAREIPGARRFVYGVPLVRNSYLGMRRLLRPNSVVRVEPDSGTTASGRPRILPKTWHLVLMRSQTEISIQRAKDELGYRPKFNLSSGGAVTAQWLRWAGFSPPDTR